MVIEYVSSIAAGAAVGLVLGMSVRSLMWRTYRTHQAKERKLWTERNDPFEWEQFHIDTGFDSDWRCQQ